MGRGAGDGRGGAASASGTRSRAAGERGQLRRQLVGPCEAALAGPSGGSARPAPPGRSGTSGRRRPSGSGSRSITAASTWAGVSRRNRGRPVAISHRMRPTENWSVRWSTVRPLACSGDMYSSVPSEHAGLRSRSATASPAASMSAERGHHHLGQAEVEDLQAPLGRDHQVLRLQVAMDDAGAMRLGQAVRELRPEVEHLRDGQGAARQPPPQRLALDVLHHHVVRAGLVGRLADVVDVDDVRVVERGGGARLAVEPVQQLGIGAGRAGPSGPPSGPAECRALGRPRPSRPRPGGRSPRRSRRASPGVRACSTCAPVRGRARGGSPLPLAGSLPRRCADGPPPGGPMDQRDSPVFLTRQEPRPYLTGET